MWPGWVALGPGDPFVGDDYVELVNNQRAYSYARNAGITWLLECLDCPEAAQVMPGGPDFLSPELDPAPWYDADNPDTWGFYGVVGLEVVGSDTSTRQVTITSTLQAGGVAGPPYFGPRTIVFRGLLIAQDECSLQAGMDWLRSTTVVSEDPCHGDALTFFDCCPCVCEDTDTIGPCWVTTYRELKTGPFCAELGPNIPAYWDGTIGSFIGPNSDNVAALSDYDRLTWVFHVRGPGGASGPVVSQWSASTNQRSWQLQMINTPDSEFRLQTSATGTASNLTQDAPGTAVAAGVDQHLAVSREVVGAQEHITSWVGNGNGGWGYMGESPWAPLVNPLDMSESIPVRIGNTMVTGAPGPDPPAFAGRIYSVELREGLDPADNASNPGIVFPGTPNDYLSVADFPALSVSGDLEVVFAIDFEDFMTIGKWRNPSQRSWQLQILDTTITLFYSLDGTSSLSVTSGPIEDVSVYHWYKVTRLSSNGTIQFWQAPFLSGRSPEPTSGEWSLISTHTGTAGVLPYLTGGADFEAGGNPTVANDGRLYRTIVRNFITTSVTTKSIYLPNVSGVRISAPVLGGLSLVGDIDIILRATMTIADVNAHTLFSKSGGATNRSWEVGYVNQRWNFKCALAADPATVLNFQPNVAQTLNQAMWFRVTRVAATGTVEMFTAVDQTAVPTAWTLLTGGSFTSTTGPLFNSTAQVEIGGRNSGVAEFGVGRVRRAIMRNGIGGPTVFDCTDQDFPHAAVGSFVCTSGQTLTVHRNGNATPLFGTVLDFADDQIPTATTTSFTAATGQTVDVVGTPLVPIPVEVLWRFDADEYPGVGSAYADPRGRVWRVTSSSIIPQGPPTQGDVWWPVTYGDMTTGPPVDDEDWCAWIKRYYDLTNGPPGWGCCVDECVVPYLRQFYNTRITEGPVVLRQPVMHSCGAMMEIEVTLVAADPRKYTMPSATMRTIVDPGEPLAEIEAFAVEESDPFAISGVTTARHAGLATRTLEAPSMSSSWVRTRTTSVPPVRGNILRTAVPIITVSAIDGDVGEVRLGLWRGGTRIDGYWLPFVPGGTTITIDGGLRRVLGNNGHERILSGFARDYDGGRVTWPELGHGVFELTVDQEPDRAGRLVIEVHAVDVGLS